MSQSKEQILEELQQRRRAFDQLCQRLWNDHVPSYESFNCCTCPVCGYPTLSERGNYDLCVLCDWEDDGQDDDEADEVWYGPNSEYSLSEARMNFARFGTMYRPGTPEFECVRDRLKRNEHLIGLYNKLLASLDTPDLPERVLEVKRFLGKSTTLEEYLDSQALTYQQREGVILEDWWLPHPVWHDTPFGHGPVTPGVALELNLKLLQRMWSTCELYRIKMRERFDRQPCAACGLPALERGEKGFAGPCRLCGWHKGASYVHDWIDDDPELHTARLNFSKYLTVHAPGDEPAFSRSQDNLLKKCLLIRAYLGLIEGPSMNLRMLDEVMKLEKEVFGAEDS